MDIVEKKEYIQSRLKNADEELIDQFYEILRKQDILRTKLIARAKQAEEDIRLGNVYSKDEEIKKTDEYLKRWR
jgi:vacuolar-type H+-ATPase subunit D/Vma8